MSREKTSISLVQDRKGKNLETLTKLWPDVKINIICEEQETMLLQMFKSIESYCSSNELSERLKNIKDTNIFRESDGMTAFHLAILENQEMLANVLIQNGAHVNLMTLGKIGETPLHIACEPSVDVSIVNLLLCNGADVNLKSLGNGWIPLHKALTLDNIPSGKREWESQYSKLELLLRYNSDANIRTNDNKNALVMLFENNFTETLSEIPEEFVLKSLKLLLDHGFDVKQKDGYGLHIWRKTPLQLAIISHPYCMETLIRRGANVFVIDNGKAGETVMTSTLDYSNIYRKETICYIKLLMNHGVSINSVSARGQSILHKAVQPFYTKTEIGSMPIGKLLELGVNANIVDMRGETALMLLSRNHLHWFSNAWTKLADKVDINNKDYDGRSLLMRAMKFGNPRIIKGLMRYDVNVNDVDKCGRTALHHLILVNRLVLDLERESNGNDICRGKSKLVFKEIIEFEQKLEIIKVLVKSNADCNIKDKFGKAPYEYIEEEHFEEELVEYTAENRILRVMGKPIVTQHAVKAFDIFTRVDQKLTSSWDTWNCIDTAIDMNIDTLEKILSTPGIGAVECVPEFKKVQEQVDKAMLNLADKMTSETSLTFDIQLSGSVSEGTKFGFPDEYDYLMFIGDIDHLFDIIESSEDAGFAKIKLKDKETCPDFCNDFVDEDGYIVGDLFCSFFYYTVYKALQDGEVLKETDLYHTITSSNQTGNAMFLFQLTSPAGSFNDIDLTIDLVPALKFPTTWWPAKAKERSCSFLVNRTSSFCQLLSKHKDEIKLRTSSSLLETEIINSLPVYMKKAYILLKILNNYFHVHLPSAESCNSRFTPDLSLLTNGNKSWLIKTIFKEKFKTYAIKTTLLHVACCTLDPKHERSSNNKEIENCLMFAEQILMKLILCSKDQILPNFFFPDVSVLSWSPYDYDSSLKTLFETIGRGKESDSR